MCGIATCVRFCAWQELFATYGLGANAKGDKLATCSYGPTCIPCESLIFVDSVSDYPPLLE